MIFSNYRLGLHRLKPSFPLLVKLSLHFFSFFFHFAPFFEQKTLNKDIKEQNTLTIHAHCHELSITLCQ